MPKKLFLIDAHSHIYQAFHAIRGLSTPDGQPTNAVFGFTSMLKKLVREQKPDFLAVAFDTGKPSFRQEEFQDYKANRKPMPDELISQLPLIREVTEAYGIPIYACDGYEADDVIGTLARQAEEKDIETYIATTDKDIEQLLSPSIKIFNPRKNKVIDVDALAEDKKVRPDQITDVMGLAGDTSDNIPGVPGVGLKTAIALIEEFGSLEGVLQNIDKIPASKKKLRERLTEFADQARLSKRLATIKTDAPVEIDLDKCRVGNYDEPRLREIFQRLGFNRFLSEMLPSLTDEEEAAAPTDDAHAETVGTGELPFYKAAPKSAAESVDYRLVGDSRAYAAFLKEIKKQKRFALDLETTSIAPIEADIVGLSFSWKEREAYYVPVMSPESQPKLDRDSVLRELRPILENDEIEKVGQNLKYDLIVLKNYGVELRGIAFDTMIASYLLDPTSRRHNLDDLALQFLAYKKVPTKELIGAGKKETTMDKVDVERVCQYACEDADIAWRLAAMLEPKLKEEGHWELFNDVELPLIDVLAAMEWNGISLDAAVLKEMSSKLEEKLGKLKEEIHTAAGEEFNIDSPKQLSKILFEKLALQRTSPAGVRIKKTKTGYSTSADVLEDLAVEHALPAMVLEYRQLSKLKSTYVDALPNMVSKKTGKIHASFNQTITATGRLSSSDPNLQNIPIRTELGRQIRRAFVPSPPGVDKEKTEYQLLTADYSQIELRILAHVSDDEMLLKAFRNDEDIHASVASQIYEVELADVTSEMRRIAKAVNFGTVYGQTAHGLSRQLRISRSEAQKFINSYFERYQGVKEFTEKTIEEARKNGYVTTMLGRKRRLPDINSSDRIRRQFAERTAVNTVVQGSAADLIKVAMNRIHSKLCGRAAENRGAPEIKMLLQIHDELVFEAPSKPKAMSYARQMITNEMSSAMELKVPIKVNVEIGANWMEAK